eukprot:6233244-Pyramimonas_sp.AAC.1
MTDFEYCTFETDAGAMTGERHVATSRTRNVKASIGWLKKPISACSCVSHSVSPPSLSCPGNTSTAPSTTTDPRPRPGRRPKDNWGRKGPGGQGPGTQDTGTWAVI